MSKPYEADGRTAQKQRTRRALVEAARDLVSSGLTPTVEQAAANAAISRTTAYRYFPNQRALLMAAHPETAATSLLPSDPPSDPYARLETVIDRFTQLILDTEAQQRTMPSSPWRGPTPIRNSIGSRSPSAAPPGSRRSPG